MQPAGSNKLTNGRRRGERRRRPPPPHPVKALSSGIPLPGRRPPGRLGHACRGGWPSDASQRGMPARVRALPTLLL